MPWCTPVPWANPVVQLPFNMSAFGGGYSGAADFNFNFAPLTLNEIDMFMTVMEQNAYTWEHVMGPEGLCLCVTANADGPLPTTIKHDFEGGGVLELSELSKEDIEPMPSEKEEFIKQCFLTLFGCTSEEFDEVFGGGDVTKDAIVAAVQAGLGEVGGPEPSTSAATIIGTFPSGFVPGDVIPDNLGPVINPSCDPDSGLVSLVIDLNIPAGATGSAQTTFTVEDASAGWGTTHIVDKATNTVLAQTYPPGAGGAGNTTPVPFDHQVSFSIPPTGGEDICMVINAFGSAGSGPFAGTCDEIGPGETILTVTPDPCGPARACFEQIFGCSIFDMLNGDPGFQDLIATLSEPPNIAVPDMKCGTVSAEGELIAGNLPVERLGTGQYRINTTSALAATVTPHRTVGADDVQPIVSIGVNQVGIQMREQDNGGAEGVLRDEAFSVILHCGDEPGGGGEVPVGPVKGEIVVVGSELQITLVNETAAAVAFDIKRDPGRDSAVTVAAGETKVQKYGIKEVTEVRVTALNRILASGTFEAAKKG